MIVVPLTGGLLPSPESPPVATMGNAPQVVAVAVEPVGLGASEVPNIAPVL